MRILITGASGFSGEELVKILPNKKILLSRYMHVESKYNTEVLNCNLNDIETLSGIMKKYKPEKIYHLAGSFTNDYNKDFKLNFCATKNILDCVNEFSPKSRVLLIGSAAEYGLINEKQCPVDENQKLTAHSPYGLTKIFQKSLMDYYVNAHSLDIVMARPFNLYGKGISSKLFIGKVYKEINNIKAGLSNEILLGNLEAERDYIDIRAAVQHYVKIMDKGIKGEVYNVGCGFPIKIENVLRTILKQENIDFSVVKANSRPAQANDSDKIYADITKLKQLYDE